MNLIYSITITEITTNNGRRGNIKKRLYIRKAFDNWRKFDILKVSTITLFNNENKKSKITSNMVLKNSICF